LKGPGDPIRFAQGIGSGSGRKMPSSLTLQNWDRARFAARAGIGGEFQNFHPLQGSLKIFSDCDHFFPKQEKYC
jgi:hypothetical protein